MTLTIARDQEFIVGYTTLCNGVITLDISNSVAVSFLEQIIDEFGVKPLANVLSEEEALTILETIKEQQ